MPFRSKRKLQVGAGVGAWHKKPQLHTVGSLDFDLPSFAGPDISEIPGATHAPPSAPARTPIAMRQIQMSNCQMVLVTTGARAECQVLGLNGVKQRMSSRELKLRIVKLWRSSRR